MQSKLIRFLDSSASGLLLAVAVALLIGDQTAADVILPHDPIFAISVRHLFWLGAGAALVTSLFVLFNGRATWPLLLLAWLATNFLVYQCGLYWQSGHGLTGYLGGVSRAFGLWAKTANVLTLLVAGYLLAASCGSLFWRWQGNRCEQNLLKAFCPSCGGHVKFPSQNLGREITCPHCRAAMTLRSSDEKLKMTCVLCGGHVEFPAHAIGQKIPCPHCQKTVTLLKPNSVPP